MTEIKLEEGKTYTTDSGLKYKVIKLGTGNKPESSSDTVEVHYHGTLENGEVFDSSVQRGEKISFKLNQVIPGWTEGLQLMPIGSKFEFTIPPELAYGTGVVCWPTSELDKERERIPKEAFVGEKCTFVNPQTNEEEPGELMNDPRAHQLAGKTLIFEVELFSVN